ncbi:DUF92 domain-containing protein [Mucilaginibacter gynuensis]|uniref:DUF92 domain-containing protein n=1 Tax=Mucilaginibacter gynuensis TaxID=1302236 RepID=A0ABP8G349_9SPHI
MTIAHFLLIIIITAGMIGSVKSRKLTLTAAITGGLVSILIYICAAFTGIAIITTFFLAGTLATLWQRELKQSINAAEANGGRRTAGQVLANAGVAGLTGIATLIYPDFREVFQLMLAASFASAMADTLASELGMLYGRRFFNILTLKADIRGENGVISIEGLLIGVAGSSIIALIYAIGFGWSWAILKIIIAGTIGNVTDSVLGASLERRNLIGNNTVNFLNTLIAGCVVLLF